MSCLVSFCLFVSFLGYLYVVIHINPTSFFMAAEYSIVCLFHNIVK